MDKATTIAAIGAILDRGTCSTDATSYFRERKHDELVDSFRAYIEAHKPLLGAMRAEVCQALNDRGTDLLLYGTDWKIGFQIKSHHDVRDAMFSFNVKRQMAESFAHGLDKWYLLICSPLVTGREDYTHKIAHLLNELSSLKTSYLAAYGPRNVAAYFDGAPPLPEEEFRLEVQRRTYEKTSQDRIEALLRSLGSSPPATTRTVIDPQADPRNVVVPAQNAGRFARILGWNFDSNEMAKLKEEFAQIADSLARVPQQARELFNSLIFRADDRYGDEIPWAELRDASGLSDQAMTEQLVVLERYDLASTWYDEEERTKKIRPINPKRSENEYWSWLRAFSKDGNVRLRDIIVELRFDLLDEPIDDDSGKGST